MPRLWGLLVGDYGTTVVQISDDVVWEKAVLQGKSLPSHYSWHCGAVSFPSTVCADKSKRRARPQDSTVNDVSLENCKPFSREALATPSCFSSTEVSWRAVSTHMGMHTHCRDRCQNPCDRDFWSPQSFLLSRSHSAHHESPWVLNANLFCSQASELNRCQTDVDGAVAAAACDRSTQRRKKAFPTQEHPKVSAGECGSSLQMRRGLDLAVPQSNLKGFARGDVRWSFHFHVAHTWLNKASHVLVPSGFVRRKLRCSAGFHLTHTPQSQPKLGPSGFCLGQCCGMPLCCGLLQKVSLIHIFNNLWDSNTHITYTIIIYTWQMLVSPECYSSSLF